AARFLREKAQEVQQRGPKHVVAPRQSRVAAIDREEELKEVVRPDRDEVDMGKERGQLPSQSRHLQHDPYMQPGRSRTNALQVTLQLEVGQSTRLQEFIYLVDHRVHDAQFASGCCSQ